MEFSIQEILNRLAQRFSSHSETPLLDAQVLVAHCLDKPRSWVLAHPDVVPKSAQYAVIDQSAQRMEAGEPLPYVLGHWEFFGLDFLVTPDVLIPRPETELLVERANHWLQQHPHSRQVVDVGTGSGCIGISIARHIADAYLVLADISPAALLIARQNAIRHNVMDRVELTQADLLEGVPGVFDLICANLPYIPTQKLQSLQVAEREPLLALNGGSSGTQLISQLFQLAKGRLIAGGLMLIEIESSLGGELYDLARLEYPRSKVNLIQDLAGKDRLLEIERPHRIVHLCTPEEWLSQDQQTQFRDHSLEQDGFIHCCQPEQMIEVANRYYRDEPELVLLWINPEKLSSEIRWEPAENVYFPHVYGPLNSDAIETTTPLYRAPEGVYRVS